jgi:2-C-methyl-D-erythritol 4-phosphate cytidylyltransferase
VEVWAVVVAAGSGSRFGGPKLYEDLAGRTVLEWSVDAARAVAHGVVLVAAAERVASAAPAGVDAVVEGGETRSASVRAGLAAVPSSAQVIVVHDGARPLASPALFRAVVDAVEAGAEGAIPAVAIDDTVKRVRDGVVDETLERHGLVAVQTPQAFAAAALRRAHAGGAESTDDAAVVEATGGRIAVVAGEATNFKITRPADLSRARAWVAGGAP